MGGDVYLYRRAETEFRMAARASDPSAARVHYALANHYLDRFYHPGEGGFVPERAAPR